MKYLYICLGCLCLTGCSSLSDEQKEFNQEAKYYIQHDGVKLIEYIDKDSNMLERDKQAYKSRKKSLDELILKIE